MFADCPVSRKAIFRATGASIMCLQLMFPRSLGGISLACGVRCRGTGGIGRVTCRLRTYVGFFGGFHASAVSPGRVSSTGGVEGIVLSLGCTGRLVSELLSLRRVLGIAFRVRGMKGVAGSSRVRVRRLCLLLYGGAPLELGRGFGMGSSARFRVASIRGRVGVKTGVTNIFRHRSPHRLFNRGFALCVMRALLGTVVGSCGASRGAARVCCKSASAGPVCVSCLTFLGRSSTRTRTGGAVYNSPGCVGTVAATRRLSGHLGGLRGSGLWPCWGTRLAWTSKLYIMSLF